MTLEDAILAYGDVRAIPVSKPVFWDLCDSYMANCLMDSDPYTKNSTIVFDFYEQMGPYYIAYKPLKPVD